MLAASATPSCPAAARFKAPERPPPRISAVETPAFASSSIAFADSVAENTVVAPASIAASFSWAMFVADSWVAAETADIAASNSANRATAIPIPVASRPPATSPAAPSALNASFCFSTLSVGATAFSAAAAASDIARL